MTTEDLTLAAVEGALPPAAIMCLGHRLAAVAGDIPFAPDRIVFAEGGLVHMRPGPVSPRWRAPEVRSSASHTTTSELWSLGRLLLELSLGRAVDDATADRADAAVIAGLFDVDGNRLPDRVVEILAVLLNPKADERLQSARAAERVFKDAELRFGDGAAALGAALANAARRVAERDGVGDPHEEPARTMQLSTRDILDTGDLKKAAIDAEVERRRQQSIPVKRTEELPARAILSAEELDRVAQAAKKKEQMQLPTQIVRKRETGSAPIDAEIIQPAPSPSAPGPLGPRLLGPASSSSEPPPAPLPPSNPVIEMAPLSPPPSPMLALPAPSEPSSSEPASPSSASSSSPDLTMEAGEEAMERAFLQGERRRRSMMIAAGVAVVVVLVLVVAVAMNSTPTPEPLPEGAVLAPVD